MDSAIRDDLWPGLEVEIVLKEHQKTGQLTKGIVAEVLTKAPKHPRGIKVRLTTGQVGRVQKIESSSSST